MSQVSLMYWNDKFGRNMARRDEFLWEITGAKTVSPLVAGQPGLFSFDALTQAQLDAELSASEVAVAKFDATAMGTNMFGGVVQFGGQIEKLVAVECEVINSDGAVLCKRAIKDAGLTDSTAASEATKTSSGNLALRFLLGDSVDAATAFSVDAATDGIIKISVHWISK